MILLICLSLFANGRSQYLLDRFGRCLKLFVPIVCPFSKRVRIYTIIFLNSVSRRSQTAGSNSCSIVSGNVSNCSYRLTVHPVTSSRLSPA